MNKKIRYFLLLFGFIIFLILAPTIVLYVTGNTVDPETRQSVKTGILAAKSLPNSAKFFIDDEEIGKTPYNSRSLRPKDYEVRLEKEGYFTWKKKIPVWENQVTHLGQGVDAVHLIKIPSEPQTINKGVTDFQYTSNTLWYITGAVLVKSEINNSQNSTNLKLNFAPTSISLLNDNVHLVLRSATELAVYNSNTEVITYLPKLTSGYKDLAILSGDNLIYLNDGLLITYNLKLKKAVVLLDKVQALTIEDDTIYWQKDSTLFSGQWSNPNILNINPLITDEALSADAKSIVVTNRKEVFILVGSNLYRVNLTLKLLNEQTTDIALNPYTNEVSFTTGSELWFYNFGLTAPQLLTRSNAGLGQFFIRTAIGYGFLVNNEGLYALEIDNRDMQNNYLLTASPKITKLIIGPKDELLFFLNDSVLQSIEIK